MKIKNELISIIVPVYNVEPFIEKCMLSILSQSYKNLEIILINDGSTDNSGNLCDAYSAIDSRVKVIHKKNGGLVSARNAGLEVAKGEYIGFVDSDDWIEVNMYESMYNCLKKHDAEICICNYLIDSNTSTTKLKLPFSLEVLNKKDILNHIVAPMISPEDLEDKTDRIHGAVWRMLIRHELIIKHKLRFQLDLMEDKIFNIQLYLKCNKVSVDYNFHYHYCIYPNTLSTKFREQRFQLLKQIDAVIVNTIKAEDMYDDYKTRLQVQYLTFAIMSVVNELHENNSKPRKLKIETIDSICKDKKLREVLKGIKIEKYSLRKKLVLKALEKNHPHFLFYYYSFATGLYKFKKRSKNN